MDKSSEMLVEVRSNKTVKYSNVHAVWSYLLGCQSTLAQEPSSSSLRGTVTLILALLPISSSLWKPLSKLLTCLYLS